MRTRPFVIWRSRMAWSWHARVRKSARIFTNPRAPHFARARDANTSLCCGIRVAKDGVSGDSSRAAGALRSERRPLPASHTCELVEPLCELGFTDLSESARNLL